MIEARGLVKRYGPAIAVDHLSFDVRPGTVTGFLGPNGAGKSTTMRMMLGLDRPDAGTVRIGGQDYRDLRCPLREVGARLEARAFHPGRTARAHLTALAASNRIPPRRVSDVLEITGMEGGRPVRGQVLPGHVPAARHRGRAARRPGRAAARRAGQRPGPRGHPVDQEPAEEPGRAGPDRAGLQPPDQRGRADRRPAHRRRPGPPARPDHRGGAVRPQLAPSRRCSSPSPRAAPSTPPATSPTTGAHHDHRHPDPGRGQRRARLRVRSAARMDGSSCAASAPPRGSASSSRPA